MAAAEVPAVSDPANDLVLLERVFLRLGSADSDIQLQTCLGKFLTPVLLKLASPHEPVRKKVMELLLHINKRVRCRPEVQLPIDALIQLYQDERATSFVFNFSIIYLTMGFPRLNPERQTELIPALLSAIASRPQAHQDVIMLMIMPILGSLGNKASTLNLKDRPEQAKSLLRLIQDILLLPYWAVPTGPENPNISQIPPGMSKVTYKYVTEKTNYTPDDLEKTKQSLVNFLNTDVLDDKEILLCLIIAAADSRFSVSNLANAGIGKVSSSVDWSSKEICQPLYTLFLGKVIVDPIQNIVITPACTRIRLKIMQYLTRAVRGGILFPDCVSVVRSSLLSANTNPRLKTMGLNFSLNILSSEDPSGLKRFGAILLAELINITEDEEEHAHHAQAFTCIGQVATKVPITISDHFRTIENLFKKMPNATPELRLSIREALLALANAFKNIKDMPEPMDTAETSSDQAMEINDSAKNDDPPKPEPFLRDNQQTFIIALLEKYMDDDDPMVRFVAARYASVLFDKDHIPSKYILLLASGDVKDEVKTEALRSLYGSSRSSDIEDIVQNTSSSEKKVKIDESSTDSDSCEPVIAVPQFTGIVEYIWEKMMKRKESSNLKHRYVIGNHVIQYSPSTSFEILRYIRMCLNRDAGIKNGLPHPSTSSPTLSTYLNQHLIKSSALEYFVNMIKTFLVSNPELTPFTCMLDIVGCAPASVSPLFVDQLTFLQNQYTNCTREEIRDIAALLYAIVKTHTAKMEDVEREISELIEKSKSTKNLESQCGLIAAYSNLLERYIILKKSQANESKSAEIYFNQWAPYKDGVTFLVDCLSSNQNLLVNTACKNISLLGKCGPLPISDKHENDVDNLNEEKKESQKVDSGADLPVTKMGLVNKLFKVLSNPKANLKTKERAITALGIITLGERFPYSKNIIKGFLDTAKESKDVEIHLQIGESLVYCVDGVNSPENRNIWTDPLPSAEEAIKDKQAQSENDINLEWLLTELLSFVKTPHPNSRQAGCIWLLALLKNCSRRDPIKSKLSILQDAFMEYLSENNDIVQDVASKGLSLIYQCSEETDKKSLVDKLVDQLAGGKKRVAQVTQDTKIFEEGQLGKTPTGANLSTYKELCSFASDLNQPDLIYKFMHLANHNAMWNSKKGAAFGFHSIAQQAGSQLTPHLPKIVPRLYRYRFDPTPKIQNSMSSIWHALVKDTQKTVEKYQSEILNDLLANITSHQWRVRMSCCMAVSDLIRCTKGFNEDLPRLEDLWAKLFRVMDDIHEGTRNSAESTAMILSKYCIRIADINQGKAGKEIIPIILPVLLTNGITNTVAEVRKVSLQTVSKLVTSAGESLKPHLSTLIPALLQATGDLESTKLSQLSVMLGERQSQEVVDSVRAQVAKSHYTTETVSKCIPYIDNAIFDAMLPNVLELMKSPQLGTKIACTHFFAVVTHHLGKEITPLASKIINSLVNGLLDRNAVVRKHCSDSIGSIVGYAKESSVDKLLQKLCKWYNERDEESVRNSIALTLQSIANKNGELLKEKSNVIMPMLFFAMHAEKTPESKLTVELYEDIWLDISPGKEQGIRMHLPQICDWLKETINSPSWSVKSQAGNAIATVAHEMKSGLGAQRQQLITILLESLRGRIWQGKEKLLQALASLCRFDKEGETLPPEILEQVIDTITKECKRKDLIYKRSSISAMGDIMEALKVDHFEQVYNILDETLKKDITKLDKGSDDEEITNDEILKKKEQYILLKEVAYETLGKAWPDNSETQQKYQRVFASHCAECLSSNTRPVQVAILVALKFYIEKLILLNSVDSTKSDQTVEKMDVDSETHPADTTDDLSFIISQIITVLDYAFGVAKNIKLRKEALNILNTLGKRLTDSQQTGEIFKLKELYLKHEEELKKDTAPEIRSRLAHVKLLLQDK